MLLKLTNADPKKYGEIILIGTEQIISVERSQFYHNGQQTGMKMTKISSVGAMVGTEYVRETPAEIYAQSIGNYSNVAHVGKCGGCDALLIDKNPKTRLAMHDVTNRGEYLETVHIKATDTDLVPHDDNGNKRNMIHACPNCQTDVHINPLDY